MDYRWWFNHCWSNDIKSRQHVVQNNWLKA